jgi:hypothetical protein
MKEGTRPLLRTLLVLGWLAMGRSTSLVSDYLLSTSPMMCSDLLLAYLVFSGIKDKVHKGAKELVAILYDGAYDRLEGTRFKVEP